ncbi:Protein MAIN-LIKE 1 [Glycine max]|nr:Protein MAIN-LIKE 1 [Glycine max]
MAETGHCTGPYIHICQTQHWTSAACAYLLHLLGCTLFVNKSATHVHDEFLDTLCDLTQTRRYAWGAAGLIHMYDQLNDASISTNRQMAGYITLLQCWIYEHFSQLQSAMLIQSMTRCHRVRVGGLPQRILSRRYLQRRTGSAWIVSGFHMSYAEHRSVQDFHPISCFSEQLRWGPVVVRYRPERCIPAHRVDSWVSFDDVDDRWTHYSDHLVPAGDICVVPGQCAPDYIDWFFVISHSFMTAPQTSNPARDAFAMHPRHIPQVPKSRIPQEPAPASTHKDSDANEPKHAVEACHAIAETLEQHLNEVMPSTSTHEVIQKCLRIVKGVTEDGNVYVRSRHRRRTDQP